MRKITHKFVTQRFCNFFFSLLFIPFFSFFNLFHNHVFFSLLSFSPMFRSYFLFSFFLSIPFCRYPTLSPNIYSFFCVSSLSCSTFSSVLPLSVVNSFLCISHLLSIVYLHYCLHILSADKMASIER